MAISRWWQIGLGAALGACVGVYLPALAFMSAIGLGIMLAWASIRSDGDDAMTAGAAGYLTGVLGYGLINVTAVLAEASF